MSGKSNDKDGSTGGDSSNAKKRDNADLPVGNSPARPLWPMFVTGALWLCWIGFLAYLALDVSRHS